MDLTLNNESFSWGFCSFVIVLGTSVQLSHCQRALFNKEMFISVDS